MQGNPFHLFAFLLTSPSIGHSAPTPDQPAFAQVLRIRLGVDTARRLERRLGKGIEMLGGHSNSGRFWRYRNGLSLYADAFDHIGNDLIVDTLIFSEWKGSLGATEELRKLGLGIWRKLRVGMTPNTCLAVLPRELPAPDASKDQLVWKHKQPGMRNGKHGTFEYDATLRFADGRLEAFTLEEQFVDR